MDANKYLELWKKNVTDKALLAEINALTDSNDISNRFSGYLQFGTAGLRGILGAGTRYINKYTITKATLGIINYLKQNFENASICIAYDNRKYSQEFAKLCALLFSANGIKTYLFSNITPTPIISFAVRKYRATLGVNITCSHNPKEYNGYKVVNGEGCQISTEQAETITKFIMEADEFSVDYDNLSEKNSDITYLTTSISDEFIEYSINALQLSNSKNNLQVIYTPLHGTGYYAIPKILKDLGFAVTSPTAQSTPDPNFTTCKNPNPELLEAYDESLAMPESIAADIIIASDPDADRLGVMVKHKGDWVRLTGDELGLIFLTGEINRKKNQAMLSENSFMVTTVVSSMLASKICEKNNIRCFKELTGFKNIGDRITNELKNATDEDFIMAYEESYGYLLTTHLRDKDAITTAGYIAVVADRLKCENKTLVDYVDDIFKQYGYVLNNNVSINYEQGIKGAKAIIKVIEGLREQEITNIGDFKVENKVDYLLDNTGLEPSNFIAFNLDKGCSAIIRPSGTEPKLKIYYSSYNLDKETCSVNMKLLMHSVEELLKKLI